MNFADFEVGALLGSVSCRLDRSALERWSALFPARTALGATMPAGYVAVVAMSAYMKACAVRPPGNIHGEQSFEITALPPIGATVESTVVCVGKQQKGERRWLHLETTTRDASKALLFTGMMSIAWAR